MSLLVCQLVCSCLGCWQINTSFYSRASLELAEINTFETKVKDRSIVRKFSDSPFLLLFSPFIFLPLLLLCLFLFLSCSYSSCSFSSHSASFSCYSSCFFSCSSSCSFSCYSLCSSSSSHFSFSSFSSCSPYTLVPPLLPPVTTPSPRRAACDWLATCIAVVYCLRQSRLMSPADFNFVRIKVFLQMYMF